MAKTKTALERAAAIADPEGQAWHAEAQQRWAAAETRAAEEGGAERPAIAFYIGPDLPRSSWAPPVEAGVSREILGRFLHDRGTNLLHDVTRATPACDLDAIEAATFVHFARELAAALPLDVQLHDCLEA